MKSFLSYSDAHIFKQVIENSFDSSWVIAIPSFKLEYANKKTTENLLGYPIERFLEDSSFWYSVVHPEDREIAIQANQDCVDRGSAEAQYRMVRNDGKLIWVLARLCLIKDPDGTPVRMIGSTLDMTKIYEADRNLRESAELFKTLTNFTPVGIYVSNIKGECTFVNQAWIEIYGMDFAEIHKIGWDHVLHPDDFAPLYNEWENSINECRDFKQDFRIFNPQKGLRYLSSKATSIFNIDGQLTGFVGTVEDVTEKMEVDQMLNLQREKLVASAKMSSLGEMASGIAHEINNPLTIIIGICTRLARLVKTEIPNREAMEKDIRIIESTAFRISKIIKGLKAFSRNSESDMKEAVTLERIVDETLELCRQRFEDFAISFRVNLNGLEKEQILARPYQINQVLLNLLSNAFDAVEHQEEKWVEVRAEATEKTLLLQVIDSGAGMSKEVIDKIMQPFFTTKEVGKGTGLGLSISKGIIEDHHGQLYLDLKKQSTTFILEFKKILQE